MYKFSTRNRAACLVVISAVLLVTACGGGGGGSAPETPITPALSANTPPVANAGIDRTVEAGAAVTLDASSSSDADGNALTYAWTLDSSPPTSSVQLSGASSAQATFVADVDGVYEISLVVNDGTTDSQPASIVVTARNTVRTIPFRRPSPLAIRQIHSGHSLTDAAMFAQPWPGHGRLMWSTINPSSDYLELLGKSTIPGSPLAWRWANSVCCGEPDARRDIAEWELLVITERVPFDLSQGTAPGSYWYTGQLDWMRTWVEHAWNNGDDGSGIPTVLFATWTDLEQGEAQWREELDRYQPLWEQLADYGAENLPDDAYVYIIPGNLLMMRLFDDIAAGLVPDVTSIFDFFTDSIHPNGLGSYALALLHMSVIHHTHPGDLEFSGFGLSPEPTLALVEYLQAIVWEIATGYERAGVPAA